jgi:hypothetical protein
MTEAHWKVEQSSYRMPRDHKPVVILYDPTPGGKKNDDGTTTYSLRFPAIALTEWVKDPENAAQEIADALNKANEKTAQVARDDLARQLFEASGENGAWRYAPTDVRGRWLCLADIAISWRSPAAPAPDLRAALDQAREDLCNSGHNLTLGYKLDGFDLAAEAALSSRSPAGNGCKSCGGSGWINSAEGINCPDCWRPPAECNELPATLSDAGYEALSTLRGHFSLPEHRESGRKAYERLRTICASHPSTK